MAKHAEEVESRNSLKPDAPPSTCASRQGATDMRAVGVSWGVMAEGWYDSYCLVFIKVSIRTTSPTKQEAIYKDSLPQALEVSQML